MPSSQSTSIDAEYGRNAAHQDISSRTHSGSGPANAKDAQHSHHRNEIQAQLREQLVQRQTIALSIIADFLDQSRLQPSLNALVGESQNRIRSDRVVVALLVSGKLTVKAISQQAIVDPSSSESILLTNAMQEAIDQDKVLIFRCPSSTTEIQRKHETLAAGNKSLQVCSVPMFYQQELIGALLFQLDSPQSWSSLTITMMRQIADLAAPLIYLRQQAEQNMLQRLRSTSKRALEAGGSTRHLLRKLLLTCLTVLVVLSSFIPYPQRVIAHAEVAPKEVHVISAPRRGQIELVNVQPGDTVTTGTVLLKLDSRELELERAELQNEVSAKRTELRSAMASHEKKTIAVARAKLEQSLSKLALAEQHLAQSELKAPVDGIVVLGEYEGKTGAPIDKGVSMFEVAPPDDFKLYLMVNQRFIHHIQSGQSAALVLKSDPARQHKVFIENISPVAVSYQGENVFRLAATFTDTPEDLKPGQTGAAKITVAKSTVLRELTRDFVSWIRITLWRRFG